MNATSHETRATQHPSAEQLIELALGIPEGAEPLRRHLADCADCRQALARETRDLAARREALRAWAEATRPSREADWSAVADRILPARRQRGWRALRLALSGAGGTAAAFVATLSLAAAATLVAVPSAREGLQRAWQQMRPDAGLPAEPQGTLRSGAPAATRETEPAREAPRGTPMPATGPRYDADPGREDPGGPRLRFGPSDRAIEIPNNQGRRPMMAEATASAEAGAAEIIATMRAEGARRGMPAAPGGAGSGAGTPAPGMGRSPGTGPTPGTRPGMHGNPNPGPPEDPPGNPDPGPPGDPNPPSMPGMPGHPGNPDPGPPEDPGHPDPPGNPDPPRMPACPGAPATRTPVRPGTRATRTRPAIPTRPEIRAVPAARRAGPRSELRGSAG